MRGAIEKLGDARAASDRMKTAPDSESYRRAFVECCGAIRAAKNKLRDETKRLARQQGGSTAAIEFQQWWNAQHTAEQNDPLLRWVADARDSDVHQGDRPLLSHSTYIAHLDSSDLEPGPDGAAFVLGAAGAFWAEHSGTPREKLTPVRVRRGTATSQAANVIHVSAMHPPALHNGEPVHTAEPKKLCDLAIAHWVAVTDEAIARWWSSE